MAVSERVLPRHFAVPDAGWTGLTAAELSAVAAVPVAVTEAVLAPETKWPRWLTRTMGREGCGFLQSREKEERDAGVDRLHEFGTSEDELDPLLDWSTQGSPRERFLLNVIQKLRCV